MRKAKYRERMYCKLYIQDSLVTLLGVNHSGDMAWISRGRRGGKVEGRASTTPDGVNHHFWSRDRRQYKKLQIQEVCIKSCQRPFRHVTAPFHYHSTVTETCFLCELRAEAASVDEEEEAEVLDGKGGRCSRGGGITLLSSHRRTITITSYSCLNPILDPNTSFFHAAASDRWNIVRTSPSNTPWQSCVR